MARCPQEYQQSLSTVTRLDHQGSSGTELAEMIDKVNILEKVI